MWKEEAPLLSPDLLIAACSRRLAAEITSILQQKKRSISRLVNQMQPSWWFSFVSLCTLQRTCTEQDVRGLCMSSPAGLELPAGLPLPPYCMSKSAEHCMEHAEEARSAPLSGGGTRRLGALPFNPLLPTRGRVPAHESKKNNNILLLENPLLFHFGVSLLFPCFHESSDQSYVVVKVQMFCEMKVRRKQFVLKREMIRDAGVTVDVQSTSVIPQIFVTVIISHHDHYYIMMKEKQNLNGLCSDLLCG